MPRTWSAVLARTGVRTGDGRILSEGGITHRSLPLPLLWQRQTEAGHGGAVVVGRIEELTIADGLVTARGSFLDVRGAEEAATLTDSGVTGPSVDLFDDIDVREAVTLVESGVLGPDLMGDMDDVEYVMDAEGNTVVISGRIAAATLVPIPAFADVSIDLDPEPVSTAYTFPSEYETYSAYTASLATFAMATRERLTAPVLPPAEWFARPDVDRVTPLTVTEDGRVFGHIAPWGECHVGLPGCVTAPSSLTNYAHFHTGAQPVQGGQSVPVGTLVTGPRHADPQAAFRAAQQHYDDLDAAVARVVAGEDEFGIWVAGWMLPDANPARVEQFLASPVSGDWRNVGGSLELIAVCSVNAPGFPVPRARVAFSNGAQQALIGSFGVTAQRGEIETGNPWTSPDPAVRAARARWAAHEWKAKVG